MYFSHNSAFTRIVAAGTRHSLRFQARVAGQDVIPAVRGIFMFMVKDLFFGAWTSCPSSPDRIRGRL